MQWLTLGMRANVVSGLHLDAAVDIGMVSPNFEYGPPVAPWQLILGLGWSFDPTPQVREVPVPAPAGPPPAVLEGRIIGQVLGPDGAAIPEARVSFPGQTTNVLLTDERGGFTSFRFAAGTVAVSVQSGGQVVWEGTAEVSDGRDTDLTIQLQQPAAAPTGLLQGSFKDTSGTAVKVSMAVRGQGVDEPFDSTEGGLIALELPAGDYEATLRAPGYRDQTVRFTVTAGAEARVDATMERDQPAATPGIDASKTRIRVKAGIRYQGDTVAPASHAALEELATFLAGHPEYATIEIGVHTDDRGNPSQRSEARAEAVRAFLLARGIAGDRVVAKGYGDTRPIAVNMTAAGRAQNNRTEIRVTSYRAP
jgi:outer membrane protein OmpA-like peptidoglycan-associated protein